MSDTLIICDFSWQLHRFHWGFRDKFVKKDEESIFVGSLLGFSLFVERVSKKYPDAKIVFVMDGKCTKKELNEEYKAQRDKKENVHVSTEHIVNILSNVPKVYFAKSEQHEADDVIANMAYKFKDEFKDIIVYSGDKDFFQLANDFTVSNEYEKGFKKVTPNLVFEKFGVGIDSLLAFRVLDGDASDNLKAPVARVKTEFKKEIAEIWKDDLTIDNFIEIMYSYKGTKQEVVANKYLEAIDKVENNLLIMDLKKYINPELRFNYNMFRCSNPDRDLINYYGLRQFEIFLYDLTKEAKAGV